ncbi:C2H2-type zinc finger transcription factor [Rhizophagus irregularis DAOM 181602=DAOM 197198]|nr:C2H2-type zinc finger transcription factor [Rhizophagus irregularis DAOM 181602=DAOM 197198]
MYLSPECINALKYPAFWRNRDDPSLKKFLDFRRCMGDLKDPEMEHSRYNLELNTITSYYDGTTEIGKKARKWKEEFKDDKKSNSVKLFWNLEDIIMESEIVDEESRLQWKEGMKEFEGTGLRYLKETSFAVQEKQISSYKRNVSKIDEESASATSTKKTKTFNVSFDEFVGSGETSGKTTEIADKVSEVSDSEELGQNDEESSDDNHDDEDFSGRNIRTKMEEVKRIKLAIAKKVQDEMKAEYSAKYHKLHPENKWKLPSGKFVEDILYEYTINLDHESYLHSFIIDTSDETIMNLFSEPDQQHIRECNIPSEPQVDDNLLDFLLRYRQNNPQDLRRVINIDIDLSSYNPRRDYDYYYVHEVFSHLLLRYELRPQDFSNPHLEGWFKTNLWSIIVDSCFLDVLDAEFIRGEGCSRASGQRKNKGRKDSKVRKLFGRKCDGILRKLGTPEEYAISEEGKLWDGEDGTKFLADGFKKLPKTMRDTLKLWVSFILQLVMDIPCGSICRLRRFPTTKIPESLDEVDELIAMVNDMLVAKLRIKRCLESVNNYYSSDIELKRRLKNRKEIKAGGDNFPDTQKTPKTKRIKFSTLKSIEIFLGLA